ncbi:hypothetical protein Ancab_001919 [Ancistrocladus abbreviatus]
MDYGDTILHLSVKYNQFEVLKYLVDEVVDKESLNEKDNKGNTILHLAMANKQVEVWHIRSLLTINLRPQFGSNGVSVPLES